MDPSVAAGLRLPAQPQLLEQLARDLGDLAGVGEGDVPGCGSRSMRSSSGWSTSRPPHRPGVEGHRAHLRRPDQRRPGSVGHELAGGAPAGEGDLHRSRRSRALPGEAASGRSRPRRGPAGRSPAASPRANRPASAPSRSAAADAPASAVADGGEVLAHVELGDRRRPVGLLEDHAVRAATPVTSRSPDLHLRCRRSSPSGASVPPGTSGTRLPRGVDVREASAEWNTCAKSRPGAGPDRPRQSARPTSSGGRSSARQEYQVLRQAGTERPFGSSTPTPRPTASTRCRACGTELFRSETKFDAHCGWPSFYAPLAEDRVEYIEDHSMGTKRVEVRCATCGSTSGTCSRARGSTPPPTSATASTASRSPRSRMPEVRRASAAGPRCPDAARPAAAAGRRVRRRAGVRLPGDRRPGPRARHGALVDGGRRRPHVVPAAAGRAGRLRTGRPRGDARRTHEGRASAGC